MSFADLVAITMMVEHAEFPEDLFGILVGTVDEQLHQLNVTYRQIVKVAHPDKYSIKADIAAAQAAFMKISAFKTTAEDKVRHGIYGHKKRNVPKKDPDAPPTIVDTRKTKYYVHRKFAEGDLADLYECGNSESSPKDLAFKLVRSAGDNDLVANESKILNKLYPAKQKEEKFYRYLPKLIDTFEFRGKGGASRRVNIFPKFDGYYSLAEVHETYPKGLDYRDVIWMYKRLLAGIGFAHTRNIVHGALILPHVLVHPTQHGARIVDWSYAVDREDGKATIKAISKPYRTYYAPEIFKKQPPTPATDIYMATKCVVKLLGGDISTGRLPDSVPRPLHGFFAGCLLAMPSKRPDDAWKLHEELDDLLVRLVGKPRYRPLPMPPSAKA